MIPVKAVLLDMDGTLVDSDAAVERAWHRWAAEHTVAVEVLAPILHGNPAATTIRVVRPDLDDAAVAVAAQRNLELQYDDLSDVVATPGAARLLRTLDDLGLPWAVVTSADRRLATVRLQAAGLPARHLVTVEDTPAASPTPRRTWPAPHCSASTRRTAWWSRTPNPASTPATPPACGSPRCEAWRATSRSAT